MKVLPALCCVAAFALAGLWSTGVLAAWQAERAFAAVEAAGGGDGETCAKATAAADAWAAAGFSSRYADWRDRSAADCAMANLRRSLGR